MRISMRSLALVSFAAISLAACDREPLETASRDIGTFEAIDLRGAADIRITVGEPSSLKIEGATNAVQALRTEVADNKLTIEAKKNGWSWFGDRDELKLIITTPKLTALQSAGAGNINISGLNGGEQTLRIAGAHNVEARGTLDKLTVELDGAGNVDYGAVTAQEARITVNGAGHVLVKPTQLLIATVNGVGAIQYKGDPQKVESNIHGVGSIGRE
ncbi:MAG TPA: DUF2807 domain-containing protein [Steroidobacteraceae bacterium]|nr:DUF2807 domain-containing protein [Steroidobacteraceae bacterium]